MLKTYQIVGNGMLIASDEIVKLAETYGYKTQKRADYMKAGLDMVECAIEYLAKDPGVHIIQTPIKEGIVTTADNGEMIDIMIDKNMYTVDRSKIEPDECWGIQIFGFMGCIQCNGRSKDDCTGKEITKNGVNALGHKIPLGVLVRRANKVEITEIKEAK